MPDTEVDRAIEAARRNGIAVAGLVVGRDYVQILPPQERGESVADYIRPPHSPAKAEGR